VAANDGTDGRAALYTREGTGNTFTRTILDATSSACTGIALGDVDGDGDQDAALACGTDGVVLLTNPGQPEGTWTVTTVYDGAGGANASSVEITDVDRDGTGDVVSYRADLESVRIDQAGDGSFGAAPDPGPRRRGCRPRARWCVPSTPTPMATRTSWWPGSTRGPPSRCSNTSARAIRASCCASSSPGARAAPRPHAPRRGRRPLRRLHGDPPRSAHRGRVPLEPQPVVEPLTARPG
jgi:hypothetical protein